MAFAVAVLKKITKVTYVDICTTSVPNWRKNVPNKGEISFTPLRKEHLSLHRLSQSLHQLNSITQRLSLPNFT